MFPPSRIAIPKGADIQLPAYKSLQDYIAFLQSLNRSESGQMHTEPSQTSETTKNEASSADRRFIVALCNLSLKRLAQHHRPRWRREEMKVQLRCFSLGVDTNSLCRSLYAATRRLVTRHICHLVLRKTTPS